MSICPETFFPICRSLAALCHPCPFSFSRSVVLVHISLAVVLFSFTSCRSRISVVQISVVLVYLSFMHLSFSCRSHCQSCRSLSFTSDILSFICRSHVTYCRSPVVHFDNVVVHHCFRRVVSPPPVVHCRSQCQFCRSLSFTCANSVVQAAGSVVHVAQALVHLSFTSTILSFPLFLFSRSVVLVHFLSFTVSTRSYPCCSFSYFDPAT